MAYTDQVVTAESGGNAMAKNPRSSATGLGQFIDSTWLDQVAKYRPDLAGLPQDQILALRNDPDISKEMIQHYGDENGAKLRAAGLPDTDGTRYLSHFAGPGGARAVLSADPSTPVVQVLQPGQVSANPFVRPMTAGQLVDWANGKVGGAAPTMQMPGGVGRGAFGLAGPVASGTAGSITPAGGAAMQAPEQDRSLQVAALLRTLTAADAPPASPHRRQAPGFDAQRFFALLPGAKTR
ncbi:hypothetical protein [Methylobacterium radiotolerans]|uniref:hypothetical protein n=1 Tax=Methylobacterium radiotolerans TaxID=31998 RepID=UPI002F34FAFD